MTRQLQREDAVRRQSLHPVQLVKLKQYDQRTSLEEGEGGRVQQLTTGSNVSGWGSYDPSPPVVQYGDVALPGPVPLSSGYFWQVAPNLTSSAVMPQTVSLEDEGQIRGWLYSESTQTTLDLVTDYRFRLLPSTPPTAPSWELIYGPFPISMTRFQPQRFQFDVDSPTSTVGAPDLSQVAGIELQWTLSATTSVPVMYWLDETLYLFGGGSPTGVIQTTRTFSFSDRPLTYADEPYEARVRNLSVLADEMSHVPTPDGESLRKRLSMTLTNDPVDDGRTLLERLEDWSLLRADVEVSQLNLDPGWTLDDIAALPAGSEEVHFRGTVRGVDRVNDSTLQIIADAQLASLETSSFLGDLVDDPEADPIDVGSRFDFPLGQAKGVPLRGLAVPAYTTLADPMTPQQTFAELTDASGFPDTGAQGLRIMLGNEVVHYGPGGIKTGNRLNGLTRAGASFQEGSVKNSNHAAGETVIFLGTVLDYWIYGGLTLAASLDALGVRSEVGADGTVIKTSTTFELFRGRYLLVTGGELRVFLQQTVTSGNALTQQPSTIDETAVVETLEYHVDAGTIEYGGRGGGQGPPHPRMRDQSPTQEAPNGSTTRIGNTDNASTANGGPLGIEFAFPATGSNIQTAKVEVYWDGSLSSQNFPRIDVYSGQRNTAPANAVVLGTLREIGTEQWYSFDIPVSSGTIDDFVTLELRNDPPGISDDTWGDVYQIRRRTTSTGTGSNDILTEAAAAVSAGQGVRLLADVTMHRKTAADTAGDRYPNTAEGDPVVFFPEVLRFYLETALGVDTRFVSQGGQLDDASWGLADAQLAGGSASRQSLVSGRLSTLGDTVEDAIGRFCWEHGAQLTFEESSADRVFYLFVGDRVAGGGFQAPFPPTFPSAFMTEQRFVWPSPVRTVSEWQAIERSSRDAETVFNAYTKPYFYDFRFPYTVDEIEGFQRVWTTRNLVVPSAPQNELDQFLASQKRVGRRSSDFEHAFLTQSDPASAGRAAGFYAQEGARTTGETYRLRGVPWVQAYDLQRGDVVLLDSPPWLRDERGRVFDRLDRRESDPTDELGWVASLQGDESDLALYRVGWDLSFASSLSLRFQRSSAWASSFTLKLEFGEEWDFTLGAASLGGWEEVVFDLANPDRTTGTDLSRIGTLELVWAGGTSADRIYFAQARYAGEQFVKCRVVGFSKTWGLRGDLVDLVLVEVP